MKGNAKSNFVFKSSVLRAELMKKPLGFLRKQAIEEGIDQEKVDFALDVKKDLVNLIISHRKKGGNKENTSEKVHSVFTIFIIIIAIIIFGIYFVYFFEGHPYLPQELVYSVESFMQYIPEQLFYAVTILTIFLLVSLLDPIKNYHKQTGDEYEKNDKKNDILTTILGVVIFLYLFQKVLGVFLSSSDWAALLDKNSEGSYESKLFVMFVSFIFIIFFGYYLIKILNILIYRDTTRLTRTSMKNIIIKNRIRILIFITIIFFIVVKNLEPLPGEIWEQMDKDINKVLKGIGIIIILIMYFLGGSTEDELVEIELERLFKTYDTSQLKDIPELLEKNEGRERILLREKKVELGVAEKLEEIYRDNNLDENIEKIPSILRTKTTP